MTDDDGETEEPHFGVEGEGVAGTYAVVKALLEGDSFQLAGGWEADVDIIYLVRLAAAICAARYALCAVAHFGIASLDDDRLFVERRLVGKRVVA